MKQVALKNGVHQWLADVYKTGVEKVNPTDVFKNYKPLDAGNTKLHKGILSFSLLPVVTCGGTACKGCYDIRSMRFEVVRKKRYVNTSLAVHDLELLKDLIIKQVEGSKTVKFIRLHVGGDVFSQSYVDMWKEIAYRLKVTCPDIKIYTYTKTGYAEQLKKVGINVVRSEYPEGHNYGSLEYIKELQSKYKGAICPATLKKHDTQICGVKCFSCMNMEQVFFKLH
jgi:hypothetical protein